MNKYRVILTKYEIYEVEAESPSEALEIAYDLCDRDEYSWGNPVDDFSVKEIRE